MTVRDMNITYTLLLSTRAMLNTNIIRNRMLLLNIIEIVRDTYISI